MGLKYHGRRVFRVGQCITQQFKTTTTKQKKEDAMNANAVNLINILAKEICARAKDDEERQLAATKSHPDPPPACILEPTEVQKEVERHYRKPETIRTNVNGVEGLESYEPPPILFAEREEAK